MDLLSRKRKRKNRGEDSLSVCNLDMREMQNKRKKFNEDNLGLHSLQQAKGYHQYSALTRQLARWLSRSLSLDLVCLETRRSNMVFRGLPLTNSTHIYGSMELLTSHADILGQQEPRTKRCRRSIAKVTSLANLVSPVTQVKKVGQALQRSVSLRLSGCSSPSPPAPAPQPQPQPVKPYQGPQATPTKRRRSRLWSETFQVAAGQASDKIKRQEAIFELYQGEVDLVEDLKLIQKTYHDSMRSLGLLDQAELHTMFGTLHSLLQLHEENIEKLQSQRQADGTTDRVGKLLLDWLPALSESYTNYCSNLIAAKALLDRKKREERVSDFLQRCRDSPFSRKLDLWSFLDVPRSRLLKYPLLLKNILRLTPTHHPDTQHLAQAIKVVEEMIGQVDRRTGEAKCHQCIQQLLYLDDKQHLPLIDRQKLLLCGGVLKNTRGTKLHVFLFEEVLVLTRQVGREQGQRYQVYRQPIPVTQLQLQDLDDGKVKVGGSFRGAFTGGQTAKHAFRVAPLDPLLGQAHTLQANDQHDKKQWIQLLQSVVPPPPLQESIV